MVELTHKCPDGFLDEEVRCDFTVTKELKALWAVQIDLIQELTRVCEKYDIPFYADSGTLLGAARHQGFIPWDDDIDVIMMRKDYDELCKHASEFHEPYFFQTEETDPLSYRGHAQLRNSKTTGILPSEYGCDLPFNQGIFIDIFVLDYIPDDERECTRFLSRINRLSRRIRILRFVSLNYKSRDGFVRLAASVLHIITLPFGKKWLKSMYDKREKLMRSCPESKRVMKLFFCPTTITPPMECRWYTQSTYLPFEYIQLRAPEGYDNVLKTFFGDWHVMRKASSFHGSTIFDTDLGYKEFLDKKLKEGV